MISILPAMRIPEQVAMMVLLEFGLLVGLVYLFWRCPWSKAKSVIVYFLSTFIAESFLYLTQGGFWLLGYHRLAEKVEDYNQLRYTLYFGFVVFLAYAVIQLFEELRQIHRATK